MLTNEQIVDGFRAIFEQWARELREWNTSRRDYEGLTFGSLTVDHGHHDHPPTEEHPLPDGA